MRKRLLPVIILLILLVLPLSVTAATQLDSAVECSLNVHFAKEDSRFSDVETRIYRVAEIYPDGRFNLIAPYSDYFGNKQSIGSQREWKDFASTMLSHIVENSIQPDHIALSDAQGIAAFTKLPTGLYLVLGNTAENDDGIYTFEDFFVYLPTPVDGAGLDYDMDVYPKPGEFIPKTEYTVNKLWEDSGYTSSRPSSVSVDIFKDGTLQETVILDAANNWTYRWSTTETDARWTVAEKSVAKGYTVTLNSSGNVFSIINSYKASTGFIPQTGDTFPLYHYLFAMCLSGFLMLILGIWRKRAAQ